MTGSGNSFNGDFWIAAATVIPVLILALGFSAGAARAFIRPGERLHRDWVDAGRPRTGEAADRIKDELDDLGRLFTWGINLWLAAVVVGAIAELGSFVALATRDGDIVSAIAVWVALGLLLVQLVGYAIHGMLTPFDDFPYLQHLHAAFEHPDEQNDEELGPTGPSTSSPDPAS